MIKRFLSIFLFIAACLTISAQGYNITNHTFENFHDNPQDIFFAEDADGSIWVLQQGGFTGVVISKYSNGAWESVPFTECSNCSYNIASDINGVIYVSTNVGFFAFENNTWVAKSGDIIARSDFAFDNANNLWFNHDDGTTTNLAFLRPDGTVQVIDEIVGDVDKLTIDDDNRVWFKNNMQIVAYDGVMAERYDLNIDQIDIASDNKLWFTGFGGEIGVIQNGISTEDIYPALSMGLPHISMATDRINNLMWFSVQGVDAGIGLLNLNTNDYIFINADDIYVDALVGLTNASFVSSEGRLWAAGRFESEVVEIEPDIMSSSDEILENISVFPNPTSSEIVIKSEMIDIENGTTFHIYNHLGQLVFSKDAIHNGDEIKLNVSDLSEGWYMLRSLESRLQSSFVKI